MGLDDFWQVVSTSCSPSAACWCLHRAKSAFGVLWYRWARLSNLRAKVSNSNSFMCSCYLWIFQKKYQFAQTEIFISLIRSACCWPGCYRSKVNWYCRIPPLKWPQRNTAWYSAKSVTNSYSVPPKHSQAKDKRMHAPLWEWNTSSSNAT